PKALGEPTAVTHDRELDVLAEQDQLGIASHFLEERLVDRLYVAFLCHRTLPQGVWPSNMRLKASSGSAGSLTCAKCTAASTWAITLVSIWASRAAAVWPEASSCWRVSAIGQRAFQLSISLTSRYR